MPNSFDRRDIDCMVGLVDSIVKSDQCTSRDSRTTQPHKSRVVTGNKSHVLSRIKYEYKSVIGITYQDYTRIMHSHRYYNHINNRGGGQ